MAGQRNSRLCVGTGTEFFFGGGRIDPPRCRWCYEDPLRADSRKVENDKPWMNTCDQLQSRSRYERIAQISLFAAHRSHHGLFERLSAEVKITFQKVIAIVSPGPGVGHVSKTIIHPLGSKCVWSEFASDGGTQRAMVSPLCVLRSRHRMLFLHNSNRATGCTPRRLYSAS